MRGNLCKKIIKLNSRTHVLVWMQLYFKQGRNPLLKKIMTVDLYSELKDGDNI